MRALDSGGLVFTSPPGDGQALAEELNGRAARLILRAVAAGLRADRLEAGFVAGAEVLAGGLYSTRHARRAVAALVAAGVLRRDRQGRRGAFWEKESPAKNFIHSQVVEAAVGWALDWRARPGPAPDPRTLDVPFSTRSLGRVSTGAGSRGAA